MTSSNHVDTSRVRFTMREIYYYHGVWNEHTHADRDILYKIVSLKHSSCLVTEVWRRTSSSQCAEVQQDSCTAETKIAIK